MANIWNPQRAPTRHKAAQLSINKFTLGVYIGEEDVGIWKYPAEPNADLLKTTVDVLDQVAIWLPMWKDSQ